MTFKVNLGKGIETLTYNELNHRLANLSEEEQKYSDKNARHCHSLTSIDLKEFDNMNLINRKLV